MSQQFGIVSGRNSDSVLGEVHRRASSSRSHDSSRAPIYRSSIGYADDASASQVAKSVLGVNAENHEYPTEIDLDRYKAQLSHHARAVWKRFHRPSFCRLPSTAIDTAQHGLSISQDLADDGAGRAISSSTNLRECRIAPLGWTMAEQNIFFPSLSRHSRLRPELISADLYGSKTAVQVAHYIALLDKASQRYFPVTHRWKQGRFGPARVKSLPAAREMDEHWTGLEADAARQLIKLDGPVERYDPFSAGQGVHCISSVPVSWDSQVLNAMIFLRHSISSNPDLGVDAKVHLKRKADVSPLTARVFTFGQLLSFVVLSSHTATRAKGEATAAYRSFSQVHPVPTMIKPKRVVGGQRSKPHLNGPLDQAAIEAAHGGTGYRLLLRAIELGFLIRTTRTEAAEGPNGCPSDPSYRLRFVHDGTGIKHLRVRHINSDTSAPLPRKLLRETRLVWTSSLSLELLEEAKDKALAERVRKVNKQLEEVTKAALDRILASLTGEEVRWVAGLLQPAPVSMPTAHVAPTASPIDNDVGVDISVTRCTRKAQQSCGGYSLAGLTAKEKNRVRMRLKRYEAKHGSLPTGSTNMFFAPAGANVRFGVKARKSSILEPFRDVIEALPSEQRATARSRIRSRIVRWGIDAALGVGFNAWDDGRIIRGRGRPQHSPTEPRDAMIGSDLLVDPPRPTSHLDKQEPIIHSPCEEGSAVLSTAPMDSPVTITIDQGSKFVDSDDKRGARFRSIGVTRQEIVNRLCDLVGFTMLSTFNLRALAHQMQVMSERTMCVDGEGREVKGRESPQVSHISLLQTLPDLSFKLRVFIDEVSQGAARQCERDGRETVTGSDIRHVLQERDQAAYIKEFHRRQMTMAESRFWTEAERLASLAYLERDPPVDWQSKLGSYLEKGDSAVFWNPSKSDTLPSDVSRAFSTFQALDKHTKPLHHETGDGRNDGQVMTDTDEEELFESKDEVAQIQSVRSLWGGDGHALSTSSGSDINDGLHLMWKGFYWPKRKRGHETDGFDVFSSESGATDEADDVVEEGQEGQGDGEASPDQQVRFAYSSDADSQASSQGWWDQLEQDDERHDALVLGDHCNGSEAGIAKGQGDWEWNKWFGGRVVLPRIPLAEPADLRESQNDEVEDGGGEQSRREEEEGDDDDVDDDDDDGEEERGDEDGEGDSTPDWVREMMVHQAQKRQGSPTSAGPDQDGEVSQGEGSSDGKAATHGHSNESQGEGDEDDLDMSDENF